MRNTLMLLVCLTLSPLAMAQNLVQNPSFNGSRNGWYVRGSGMEKTAWDPAMDAASAGGSGSVAVVDTSNAVAAEPEGLAQCFAVKGLSKYSAGARYRVSSDLETLGMVAWSVQYYANSTCGGASIGGQRFGGDELNTPRDVWTDVSYSGTAPAGANSAELVLGAVKFDTTGEYVVRWDDAYAVEKGRCRANNRYLCVTANRFEIELKGKDPRTSLTAEGVVVEQNGVFGYFSFPALTGDPDNAEVFVKVLDGRPVNGRFWVFYSGLTDVEFDLEVRDLEASQSRDYFKPGLQLESIADTSAF